MPEMPLAQECAMYYPESWEATNTNKESRQEVQSVRSSEQDQFRLGLQNNRIVHQQTMGPCIIDLSH